MFTINNTIISGTVWPLGKDAPSLADQYNESLAKSEKGFLRFSISQQISKKAADGTWSKEYQGFKCVAFGQVAKTIAEAAPKALITISGKLEQNRWETAEGDKRSDTQIIVREVCAPYQDTSASDEAPF